MSVIEHNVLKRVFDFDKVFNFCQKNRVEIEFGSDLQHYCKIDNKVYAIEITAFSALVFGIENYLKTIKMQNLENNSNLLEMIEMEAIEFAEFCSNTNYYYVGDSLWHSSEMEVPLLTSDLYKKFKEQKKKKQTNNITISGFPYLVNENFDNSLYDIVINVSDEYYEIFDFAICQEGAKSFWFPMNECKSDIGLNSIYGALIVLYEAHKNNKRVYLHCRAGVFRSWLVYCCFYYMINGSHLETFYDNYINQLYYACSRKYLPDITKIQLFLTDLKNTIDISKSLGGKLDTLKINNF